MGGSNVRETLWRTMVATVLAFAAAAAAGTATAARAEEGAEPKGWVYSTPVRPAVPAVKSAAAVRNPVDSFILARLEAAGVAPAPEADRATLIRRVSFDLTGLPPTPEEVAAFVADPAPDAYERLVDRLLASPRFGERWAMHWLDLVRYAETNGFKADELRPHAWRYRDYVIDAFNSDKPYDRFLREQIAGDELYPDDPAAARVATGFLRHYPDESNAINLDQRRQEILNDITDTTASVFLGLTVGCARCHNHKFDPIRQSDYYRLQAFFAAFRPDDAPAVAEGERMRWKEQHGDWLRKTAAARTAIDAIEARAAKALAAKRRSRFPKEYLEAYDTSSAKRTPLQNQYAAMVAAQVEGDREEMIKSMKPDDRKEWSSLTKKLMDAFGPPPAPPAMGMGMSDVGPAAPPTFMLKRGELKNPGREIAPGFLSVIDDREAPAAGDPKRGTTGRRAALAEWLTRPDHPLTGRVIVNRLWQHHFGRGIVGTPNDFGVQGDPPTHPELLDYLARELVDRGWSLKAMHRLMVTSAAYRRSTRASAETLKADPDNKLLSRAERRRLEGEVLRDSMLAVSGRLNLKAGGPSVRPELPAELGKVAGWTVTEDKAERDRRSVYVFAKRNLRYPLFSVFDAPDGNETCPARGRTVTAPQALTLLNGGLSLDLAKSFAARVSAETESPAAAVERAWRLALGRVPTADESSRAAAFLGSRPPAEGLVDLCHVLFNLNEFAYAD